MSYNDLVPIPLRVLLLLALAAISACDLQSEPEQESAVAVSSSALVIQPNERWFPIGPAPLAGLVVKNPTRICRRLRLARGQ